MKIKSLRDAQSFKRKEIRIRKEEPRVKGNPIYREYIGVSCECIRCVVPHERKVDHVNVQDHWFPASASCTSPVRDSISVRTLSSGREEEYL